jgi:hypothetical protein
MVRERGLNRWERSKHNNLDNSLQRPNLLPTRRLQHRRVTPPREQAVSQKRFNCVSARPSAGHFFDQSFFSINVVAKPRRTATRYGAPPWPKIVARIAKRRYRWT